MASYLSPTISIRSHQSLKDLIVRFIDFDAVKKSGCAPHRGDQCHPAVRVFREKTTPTRDGSQRCHIFKALRSTASPMDAATRQPADLSVSARPILRTCWWCRQPVLRHPRHRRQEIVNRSTR